MTAAASGNLVCLYRSAKWLIPNEVLRLGNGCGFDAGARTSRDPVGGRRLGLTAFVALIGTILVLVVVRHLVAGGMSRHAH